MEKQGQNTIGIVRRPKQSKLDRTRRAASTWQEVSVRHKENFSLPDLGREEESMAGKLCSFDSAGSIVFLLV